jgi:antirestriction protein ArdC
VAPWAKCWTGGGISLPLRSTGAAYQGINVLILMMQGRTSPHWLTYKQAQAEGGQVNKGEAGTTVVFYKQLKVEDKATGEEKRIPLLRAFTVFNLEQISFEDGVPAKYAPAEVEAINPDSRNVAVDAYITATEAKINHGGGRAFYRPSDDQIQLPEFAAFTDAVAYYGTAIHELAHWTGHATRLDRLTQRDSTAYATEELVAELSATFLGASLGIETTIREDHVSYLQGWLSVLKADKKAIFKAATKAQKAVSFLDNLQPTELEEAA